MSHDAEEARLLIYYSHCGTEWEDIWSCACDSECPVCGKDIEPYDYEELSELRPKKNGSTLKLNASKFELGFMSRIAARAAVLAEKFGVEYSHATALTDINVCHANGCELQLDELLAADDRDFTHDVFGIRDHINRKTGVLEQGFLPRFALLEASQEEEALES